MILPLVSDTELSAPEQRAVAVHLAAQNESPAAPIATVYLTFSRATVDALEEVIRAGREALAAQEYAEAERHVLGGLRLAYDHPEVPHIAFLSAELERLSASAARGLKDDAKALSAMQQATALDHGRAAAFGESGPVSAPLVTLDVAAPRGEIWIDGQRTPARELQVGRHHVLVRTARGVLSARWVDVGTNARLELPGPTGCSREDLENPNLTVQCEHWVRVHHAGTHLGVSHCRRSYCGATSWIATAGAGADAPQNRRAWLPWVIAGVLGAAAITVTAIQLGSESRTQDKPAFSNGGLIVSFR
jgi:hypothetical protein